MLAMQYTIRLPRDYDMNLIRKRVEERSKLFEALPGLTHKSYLMNEQDKIYAPFYIWSDLSEMQQFLFKDLFKGVITAFSRPRVRSWFTLGQVKGKANITPRFALRESDIIAPETDLEALVEQELKEQQALANTPGLFSHLVAFDPDRWELIRYSLWQDEKNATHSGGDAVQAYEVLHVS